MASSLENLGSIESWAFRPTFTDSWLSEAFARDTEALTRALQVSISNSDSSSLSPLFSLVNSDPFPTPSGSNLSGSDPETTLKRQRTVELPPTGKVSKSKRKSRASKRSQTTFIKADPTNFRQMVQEVTGVRFGNAQMCPGPILKPEAQRPGSLPTLDTSAFLLDHCQPSSGAVAGSGFVPLQASVVANAGASSDCDSFPCFPTLESWKA
ncbi:calmodulin (CAM)-binding protein of 25 kDa [Hibiscus trionum]|uniref:Calmodulin (CAM)-binding protein of 25 kDa n=1 Tax=Hibiscus trionum TaxID=183268 RepID=A0A9W7MHR6_HIBTR|nr:calmodulin (CAM)-binding protein of 25 kDa [Hibiscus trionum]